MPPVTIFNNATDLASMACTITMITFAGTKAIGSRNVTLTLKIDSATYKPKNLAATCTETNSVLTAAGLTTGWQTVNLLSKKNLSISFAIGTGATVKTVTCVCGSTTKTMTISGNTATCSISAPTAAVYKFTVKDSRGLSTSLTSGSTSN